MKPVRNRYLLQWFLKASQKAHLKCRLSDADGEFSVGQNLKLLPERNVYAVSIFMAYFRPLTYYYRKGFVHDEGEECERFKFPGFLI